MPTILRWNGYKFWFYSREEDRPHIHVRKQNAMAKIWLEDIKVAQSLGFSQKELGVILKKVNAEQKLFLEAWNAYFEN